MLGDKICHVRPAAVAQFYVVVANLVQSMSGRKVFSLQSAEFPTDVGANMFTIIWWVELYNLSFSRSSFVWVKTRFIFEFHLYPLLRIGSSKSGVAFANSSWLQEILERRFASTSGNYYLILGGWLD